MTTNQSHLPSLMTTRTEILCGRDRAAPEVGVGQVVPPPVQFSGSQIIFSREKADCAFSAKVFSDLNMIVKNHMIVSTNKNFGGLLRDISGLRCVRAGAGTVRSG